MKKNEAVSLKLDEEEQEILEAFEKGALKRVKNFKEEIGAARLFRLLLINKPDLAFLPTRSTRTHYRH